MTARQHARYFHNLIEASHKDCNATTRAWQSEFDSAFSTISYFPPFMLWSCPGGKASFTQVVLASFCLQLHRLMALTTTKVLEEYERHDMLRGASRPNLFPSLFSYVILSDSLLNIMHQSSILIFAGSYSPLAVQGSLIELNPHSWYRSSRHPTSSSYVV